MMLQAAVSLLNIGGDRLAPTPAQPARAEQAAAGGAERDLEQVRDAIDGVRALLEILERRIPSELRPLRDALSQLQMAYAREAAGRRRRGAGRRAAAAGARRAAGRRAARRRGGTAGRRQRARASRARPALGRPSRAAGCGCRAAEAAASAGACRHVRAGTIDCARVCAG